MSDREDRPEDPGLAAIVEVSGDAIIATAVDHDERDRRIQELQAELAHVQRLTELGQVVSTLVHQVNQPLAAINNYVNACRRLLAAGEHDRVQDALERIQDQTSRTRRIVERVSDFVKKRDVLMRSENLSQVIEEAIVLARSSMRDAGISLAVQLDPTDLLVEIDKVQAQ